MALLHDVNNIGLPKISSTDKMFYKNQRHQVYVSQCSSLASYLEVHGHVSLLQSKILCLVFLFKLM